jgi:hypothetical protein
VTKVDFDQICDTLSQQVDAAQYERLRWERTEGPMLASLVVLAHSALEERSEFELNEEGSTREIKRFILKVHGNRVVAISIWLKGGMVRVSATQIDRSPYRLAAGEAHVVNFQLANQQWMANALQDLFSRIQVSRQSPKPGPPPRQAAPEAKVERRAVQ